MGLIIACCHCYDCDRYSNNTKKYIEGTPPAGPLLPLKFFVYVIQQQLDYHYCYCSFYRIMTCRHYYGCHWYINIDNTKIILKAQAGLLPLKFFQRVN